VPAFLNFIDPEQTYLKFDLKLAGGPAPLVCHPYSGVNSCIQRIRILSGDGVLIEEIDDYNVWLANRMKYQDDMSENLKRTFTEGTFDMSIVRDQPYFTPLPGVAPAAAASITGAVSAVAYNTNTFTVPLRTGLFESKHILPVGEAGMNGLRIEIHLVNDPRKALIRHPLNAPTLAPLLCNQGDVGTVIPYAVPPLISNVIDLNTVSINVQGRLTVPSTLQANAANPDDLFGCENGQTLGCKAQPRFSQLADCPYRIGDSVFIYDKDTVVASSAFVITGVAWENGGAGGGRAASWRLDGAFTGAFPNMRDGSGVRDAIVPAGAAPGGAYAGNPAVDAYGPYFVAANYNVGATEVTTPNFTVSNAAMVCGQIMPGSSYEKAMTRRVASGEGLSIDIKSIQQYKQNLQRDITTSSIYLPIVNSRIYSIFTIPTVQEYYTFDNCMNIDDHKLLGINDNISEYQWYYEGVLHPNRRVPCGAYRGGTTLAGSEGTGVGAGATPQMETRIGRGKLMQANKVSNSADIMEQHHFYELVKSWENCGYRTKNLRGANTAFVMSRCLSKYGQTYDARGKDFQLNIERSRAGKKDLLLHTFVCHLRRLRVTPNGVQMDL
tara:strand:+ start:4263 stop:6086 length:1824 start_codon:yes stop_codon:yes gene_type:complete